MHFQLLSLLVAVPSAISAMSTLAYRPPAKFLAQAQSEGCDLPPDFHIKDFAARSNGTGSTASLVAYNFTFVDEVTKVTTFCQFNTSSFSTTPGGLTPRYACEDRTVKFIWTNDEKELTLVERVCPGTDKVDDYEVAGALIVPLSCSSKGGCTVNSTDYTVKFTSLNPVTDPTRLSKYWVE